MQDVKELAKQLREQGLSWYAIGKQIGVSQVTVRCWLDDTYRKQVNNTKLAWMNHRYHNDKAYRERRNQVNKTCQKQTKHGLVTYFIQDNEFVKIGKTDNLPKRLRELQCGNPRPLEVLGITHLPEKQLHKEFEVSRVAPNSEWFCLTPAMEVFIQENCKPFVIKGDPSEPTQVEIT